MGSIYDEVHEKDVESELIKKFRQNLREKNSLLETKIFKISSREELINLILNGEFQERKLAFLRYDQLLMNEIKKRNE